MRKLATMIPIATISVKLDSTPPIAIDAWPGALASRASASVMTAERLRVASRRLAARNTTAVRRGISAIPPTSSNATAT